MQITGYILVGLGVIDFLLGNFADINLTSFIGSSSSFSPIILMIAGGLLSQVGEK